MTRARSSNSRAGTSGAAASSTAGTALTAGTASSLGATATLLRGARMVPEFRAGLWVTISLALLATAGRVVVPIAVQQTIDRGLLADTGPDYGLVRTVVGLCLIAILVTAVSAYAMNYRLFRVTETALSALRVRAFRHVHDLSMLHQQAERRGSLVSRVTSDVDQLSMFMQWGGILGLLSLGQLVIATVIMAVYSWPLTLLVYVCFVPMVASMRYFQRRLAATYGQVRERVGDMLGAISEAVVGAQTVRAYGIAGRTGRRIDTAIDRHYRTAVRAQRQSAVFFGTGEFVAALANAGVIVVGVLLGVAGGLSPGTLVAFLFLVTLFIGPVQIATEVLNEAQNALASFRRVLDVLDTEPDVADPGPGGRDLPPGPLGVRFDHVHFSYPTGPEVLTDTQTEPWHGGLDAEHEDLRLHPLAFDAALALVDSGEITPFR